ncbi:hypothetical protein GCM10022225_80630 [Plantactinospora mayteni]|uniref:Uncharacterized protein n=1 Tax=Plantactinospora mayteni TaxID=566021 RepID=A0ABQ4F3G6_9ACTN|nr:hypothetical protein [Plantactinospora mayteni]GIH01455.1 hypothetical protein Pma05_80270 [Plantactinospora mayteni]
MLPETLAEPGAYEILSTWDLVDSVRKELSNSSLRAEVDVRPVPELMSLTLRKDVRPLEILLALGKTTSALPGLGTAGAAGMAGLTALRTASRWAITRYLWAFSDHRPDLCLSALTDQVRFHQRTILSEQFGIAIATDVVEQLILDKPASVVDADAVSYDPVLGISMSGLRSHKPDYFWYCHEDNRLSQVVVVEAKGTTSGPRKTIGQLARGVEQVLVPSQIPGVPMRRIVVGAGFKGRRICAYAVEVGAPTVSTQQDVVAVIRERESSVSARRHRQFDEDDAAYSAAVDAGDAAREALIEDQVRLHNFAGQPVTRHTLRADSQSVRARTRSLEPVYAQGATFRCESTRIALGQQTLRLRTGVADELLVSPEKFPERDLTARREYYRRGRNGHGYRLVPAQTADGRELMVLTSPDGCMLSASVE